MTPIKSHRFVARNWFINNHPLVQKWEAEGVRWDLHHWDSSLKTTNIERYNLWIIDDLVPMTHAWHTRLHTGGYKSNFYHENHSGVNNGFYGHHHTDEYKKNKHDNYSGINSWNYEGNNIRARKIKCVETGQIFDSITQAKRWLGKGFIAGCLTGRQQVAGGYHWCYCDTESE